MIFTRDQLSNVVCNIRTPVIGGEKVGTAIIIGKDDNVHILTAAHVANDINQTSYVIISDQNGNPTRVLLSMFLGGSTFVNHSTADLAKADVQLNAANYPFFQKRCFPYSQIDLSGSVISKDIELTTIGFPNGLGSSANKFSPLTYRSYVSSPAISLGRFDNNIPCDFIILENPSTQGYSGGPVFDLGYMIVGNMTSSSGATKLHGIVHGTIGDATGGKMSAITPVSYLKGWL